MFYFTSFFHFILLLSFILFYTLFDLIWYFILFLGGTNQYPPPELIEECGDPSWGDTLLQPILSVKR